MKSRSSLPLRGRFVALAVLIAGLAASSELSATTVRWRELAEIGARADLLLLGRVVSASTVRTPGGFGSYTEYVVRVDQALAGSPPSTVCLRLPGGDGSTLVEGVPSLESGVLYLFALEAVPASAYGEAASGDYYVPLGLRLGLWRIDEGADLAVRELDGLSFVGDDGSALLIPASQATPLDELLHELSGDAP